MNRQCEKCQVQFSVHRYYIELCNLHAAAEQMLGALKEAKETIQIWHGPTAWDAYQHSPEMKRINKAIATASKQGQS